MAVDLATSGSLGYGIGLQAKVPDKTGLVLQLENQRLKRQALENQAQEEEAQKAAKQEAMFQKAINVDTTKWHRTLVGKVNQAANDAVNEYSRLYAENPRVAQNSINQIMRKFNEQVSQLNTANEQRKQMHKALNDKLSRNEMLMGDEDEAYNYLNTGDDLALTNPYQTSLGEYTFNPNSTISISAIGNSGANKNAQQAADSGNYGKQEYRITPLGVEQYRGYDDNEVKRYMNDFYAANTNAKIGDIAINKPKLRAAFDASGLAQTGMTFKEFTDLSPKANPVASQIVDNVLLDYHRGLLNTYSPKAQQVTIKPSDELGKLANQLDLPKQEFVGGQYIYTKREISDKDIQDVWNDYKNTSLGKIVITLAGGEKPAKDMYEKFVRTKQESMRQMYQPSGGAGAGGGIITTTVSTPTKYINAQFIPEVREYGSTLSDYTTRTEAGKKVLTGLSETDLITGHPEMASSQEKGLSEINPNKQYQIDVTNMTETTSDDAQKRLKGKSGWSTGATKYPNISGNFRSVISDKKGNPKYIVVDETLAAGELGNSYILPYELNKGKLTPELIKEVEAKKQTTAPAKKTTTTTTTKAPKTTTMAKIKSLIGKPGYEGYDEKELVDYYKSQGYTIK